MKEECTKQRKVCRKIQLKTLLNNNYLKKKNAYSHKIANFADDYTQPIALKNNRQQNENYYEKD